jgi:N-methylhydantoinase B
MDGGPRALRIAAREGDGMTLDAPARDAPARDAPIGASSTGGVQLAVFRYGIETVTEEMHATLVRTARSTNIKDRQDTSSAIYDASGAVIAQSEAATPVHLGTTQFLVRHLLEQYDLAQLDPGDAYVTNTPYPVGPGHLNDVAVVSPVFYEDRLVAVVANQAHHVDLGGYAPGSMPFGVWEIYQEGLQIPPVVAVRRHRLDETLWRLIAQNIRDPDEVRGDLEAQIAANAVGALRIAEMMDRHGPEPVLARFADLLGYGEKMMRQQIHQIRDGSYSFEDVLEGDGLSRRRYRIALDATVADDRIVFDFSRTCAAARGPINCGLASVSACVYFVMKALAGGEIPANAGAFRPLEVVVAPGTLLSPRFPAAVCNANIVTTQRIVDVILGALAPALPGRIGAASSGTMHLLNIGVQAGERYRTLVETFAGGQGGLPGQDGMDAVHSHMTNTRNTPVEILENDYPITIEEYSLVEDSSGAGRWRGGAGIRRRYLLHAPAVVTLSSDRRLVRPWGTAGGLAGKGSTNYRLTGSGRRVELESKTSFRMAAGERLVIETPGGGGYGPPAERDHRAVEHDRRSGVVRPAG